MSKKTKQSKKSTKNSKRAKVATQAEDETDTATQSAVSEAPQPASAIPEADITVNSHQPETSPVPGAPVAGSESAPKATRSDAAKANIKEGLRLHQIAGRPTREQLILVFGAKGYAMTWAQRTERFGITPETFQAALAKGFPAVPLTPVAKHSAEETKGTL
jgi:hypothetical protein